MGDKCGGRDHRDKTECEPTLKCLAGTPLYSRCVCPDGSWWCPGAPGYPTTTTTMPSTTQTQQRACNIHGVFDNFADVCQECILAQDYCQLNCTCQTTSGTTQPITMNLPKSNNQGCIIALENGRAVCKPISIDGRHNYPASGQIFIIIIITIIIG